MLPPWEQTKLVQCHVNGNMYLYKGSAIYYGHGRGGVKNELLPKIVRSLWHLQSWAPKK